MNRLKINNSLVHGITNNEKLNSDSKKDGIVSNMELVMISLCHLPFELFLIALKEVAITLEYTCNILV